VLSEDNNYSMRTIGVIGLGYVGLPLALALSKTEAKNVFGFDINTSKVEAIKKGIDPTNEGLEDQLSQTRLKVTSSIKDLATVDFFIVGVPTPVDSNNTPDLIPLQSACDLVGSVLKKNDIVVFESTVYPGLTEDLCGKWLEQKSGLICGKDFFLGYSPERMNPGDKEHTVETIVKVVAGQTPEVLEIVTGVYSSVVKAGVFKAASIKVAEAAKVIENTQRDINIALMNELSIIFDRLGIRTHDVLQAAGTKWNFLKFTPGLVGGHCIGVDPYYLTTKAQQLGYHPQVILSGRRINDGMGQFVAQKLVKMMIQQEIPPKGARVGVLGITFKENVSDVRNSRVPDIVKELEQFGVQVMVSDDGVSKEEVLHEYGISLHPLRDLENLDALILAVSHDQYRSMSIGDFVKRLKPYGVMIDVKSMLIKEKIPTGLLYWCL
jgi:UDP-N-acetyl-D-galactosamine dehydrogenase